MIAFLITAALTAIMATAITFIGIGAGLACVLVARGFLQGGANDDAK